MFKSFTSKTLSPWLTWNNTWEQNAKLEKYCPVKIYDNYFFSKGHLSSENPDHGHLQRELSEGPVSDGRNSQFAHDSWLWLTAWAVLCMSCSLLVHCWCVLCVQPVQLEKAISNPDLRAGKVRQRSVASAENTEVAGEWAPCRDGGGCYNDDNI